MSSDAALLYFFAAWMTAMTKSAGTFLEGLHPGGNTKFATLMTSFFSFPVRSIVRNAGTSSVHTHSMNLLTEVTKQPLFKSMLASAFSNVKGIRTKFPGR